jgi:hypothetical protein
LRIHYDTLTLPLWDDLGTLVVRYRGLFPRKSLRQRKIDNIELLNNAIVGTWQTASELSKNTGIGFHQCVKLLQIAVWRYDIEMRVEDWIDHRHRNRSRTLYRRKFKPMGLYGIFGHQVIDVPHCAANMRVHVCKDD